MKYVVVCTVDREILKVGVADTPSEATEILKNDFMDAFINAGGTEEDFNSGDGSGDYWAFANSEAWLNGRYSAQYDWRILEVE